MKTENDETWHNRLDFIVSLLSIINRKQLVDWKKVTPLHSVICACFPYEYMLIDPFMENTFGSNI